MLSLLGIYVFSMNSSDFTSCFLAYSVRIYSETPYAMWLRESVRYRLHKMTIALLVCEIITLASWASCFQLLYPHSIQSDIFKLINILITSMLKALSRNFSLSVAKGVKRWGVCAERKGWFSCWEHWLHFKRTQLPFREVKWLLMTVYSSSFRGSEVFCGHQACLWGINIPAEEAPLHLQWGWINPFRKNECVVCLLCTHNFRKQNTGVRNIIGQD